MKKLNFNDQYITLASKQANFGSDDRPGPPQAGNRQVDALPMQKKFAKQSLSAPSRTRSETRQEFRHTSIIRRRPKVLATFATKAPAFTLNRSLSSSPNYHQEPVAKLAKSFGTRPSSDESRNFWRRSLRHFPPTHLINPMKTKFILLGGFLGAGKTTLVGQLARRYIADGKTVAIITNDQASDLVDTLNLRSQGFDVGEVAGACFCCSFDDLVETAGKLGQQEAPDIIIAEPVGSCTDLVATVVLPLQQILGDRFDMAPFGVLLKPSHGKRILAKASSGDKARSGFSPQAEYIFRKQLEEADYLMIGRADQLTDAEALSLTERLSEVAPDVPIVRVSPKTGEGIDQVLGYIESPMIAGRRRLDIDYDTYAEGEAEMGWVNLSATVTPQAEIDLDETVTAIVSNIADSIRAIDNATIAHLKASLIADDTQAIANVVSNDSAVEIGLRSGRRCGGPMRVIVNARVAMAPDELESLCTVSVHQTAAVFSAQATGVSAQSLRPGRPTPTHRVTSI